MCSRFRRSFAAFWAAGWVALVLIAGCTTTQTTNTERTAMEQLLISNAVDQSLDHIDFSPLAGHTVFLNASRIDCVDKNYIIVMTRARILQAGARLVNKIDSAEIVVEICSGSSGTDQTETYIGIPSISGSGLIPISIPEVKFWSRTKQTGTVKLGMVAYETDTHKIVGCCGTILARSANCRSQCFGMVTSKTGSVQREIQQQLASFGSYRFPRFISFAPPEARFAPMPLPPADGTAPSSSSFYPSKTKTVPSAKDNLVPPPAPPPTLPPAPDASPVPDATPVPPTDSH